MHDSGGERGEIRDLTDDVVHEGGVERRVRGEVSELGFEWEWSEGVRVCWEVGFEEIRRGARGSEGVSVWVVE